MMTVAQLIAILQIYPQDIPVTGYNGQEYTDWITPDGIKLRNATRKGELWEDNGSAYFGPYLDIMGL